MELAGGNIVTAWTDFKLRHMTTLARFSVGRSLLHLLAMLGDRCLRFHITGLSENYLGAPKH